MSRFIVREQESDILIDSFPTEEQAQEFISLQGMSEEYYIAKQDQKFSFRCTRNKPYLSNRRNIREGYYIEAWSEYHALKIMATKFPNEVVEGFTVEITSWKV